MKDLNLYTRVTEVLYPFSGLSRIDPKVLKNAADRGSIIHHYCDALMSNIGINEQTVEKKYKGYLESFKSWNDKDWIPKPDRFFCDEHMLTGECDGIYREGDHLVLVDLKTPLKESPTWCLQGSAYSYLAKKEGYDIKRIEFVKLCKNGNPAQVFVYQEDFLRFLRCLDLYRSGNYEGCDLTLI